MPEVIQIKRGVFANMPALASGEFYFATDIQKLYVGPTPSPTLVGTVFQTEVDFGALPVSEASFIVINSNVTPSSNIVGTVAYVAPTGKDLDELEMDELDLKFGSGGGQFTIYARGRDGYIADKFKINYVVG